MTETIYTIPGAPHIAVLADIHNEPGGEILESLHTHSPELIVIPGDVVKSIPHAPGSYRSTFDRQNNVIPLMAGCASIAPTYMSLGNNDRYLDDIELDEIRATGVVVLDNSFVTLDPLILGGLTSSSVTDHRRVPRSTSHRDRHFTHIPETEWLSEFLNTPGYHILLCHHPEYIDLLPDGIDLIISGHTHGGQWQFLGRGVFAPGQGVLPRHSRGYYKEKNLVVSAGLSNTTKIPRFFNPTEIVYINAPSLPSHTSMLPKP